MMVGDVGGASVLFEMAPGRTAVQVDRSDGTDWQVCTNFFVSGEIPIRPEPEYLESAYARYGRAVHRLDFVERSVSGLQGLLTELAQPGCCVTSKDGRSKTAYSQIMEMSSGKMYYAPGHPAELAWKVASL